MSWIAVGLGGLSAGASIAGSIEANKAQQRHNKSIKAMANAQAEIKRNYAKQSNDIKVSELMAMADQFDREVGVDLTNLLYESEKVKGQINTTLAERNITGGSAGRLQATAEIQKELSNDMLQEKLEANYNALGKELQQTQLNYEREGLEIQFGLAGALSQQNHNFKSPFQIAMGGISSGASGALTGYQLGQAFGGGSSGGGSSGGGNSGGGK